jgi:hypothetical protein
VTRESAVEAALRRDVEASGGLYLKVSAQNQRGYPDRLVILPGSPRPRMFFVELKRPGERPKAHQERAHTRLRKLGVSVVTFDGHRVL